MVLTCEDAQEVIAESFIDVAAAVDAPTGRWKKLVFRPNIDSYVLTTFNGRYRNSTVIHDLVKAVDQFNDFFV